MAISDHTPPDSIFSEFAKIKDQKQVMKALTELKAKSVHYKNERKVAEAQSKALYKTLSSFRSDVTGTLKKISETVAMIDSYQQELENLQYAAAELANMGEMALRRAADDVKAARELYKNAEKADKKGDAMKAEIAEKAYVKALNAMQKSQDFALAANMAQSIGKYAAQLDKLQKDDFKKRLAKLPVLMEKLRTQTQSYHGIVDDAQTAVKSAKKQTKTAIAIAKRYG
ncbi:MAG: hypothetical protein AAF393_01800 [Pseudomonadota bacterium]